ncbi:DNA polymerase III subunit epsilon [Wenzhouxiangella limi]|uniref:DNA polymerase III subunit epsilon n=1 Tax=Wenzhouxiangella limi TaxID=2707351 RepID=A0A845V9X3_9GAMM|nr:DNA polymerase III subunit epsilon [Wenzhouxiangella limi]
MRQIVLDTETTGLEHADGHRIIEIGCLEINDRRITERHYHVYLNPERAVESGALHVHGITDDFLADKPRFGDIVEDFLDFIRDAELIIHNAPFDVGFLNAELARLGSTEAVRVEQVASVLDTVVLARELHPGQRVSLDALCKRYEIDNSRRDLHGALLDAELLAEVYLAMTGGQVDLGLELAADPAIELGGQDRVEIDRSALVAICPSAEEFAAHQQRLESIAAAAGHCLWLAQDRG